MPRSPTSPPPPTAQTFEMDTMRGDTPAPPCHIVSGAPSRHSSHRKEYITGVVLLLVVVLLWTSSNFLTQVYFQIFSYRVRAFIRLFRTSTKADTTNLSCKPLLLVILFCLLNFHCQSNIHEYQLVFILSAPLSHTPVLAEKELQCHECLRKQPVSLQFPLLKAVKFLIANP